MPIWIGDYLADTQRLTCEQHGAYLLMIFDYWRNGPPPDDDDVLRSIVKLDAKAWAKHRPVLERMFQVRDGSWHHRRIDRELEEARGNQQRRSDKAKAAAEARWGQCSEDAPSITPSIPDALPEGCPSPSPSPDDIPNGTSSKGGKRVKLAAKPDDVGDDVWSDFQSMRRQKRAPLTETALKGIAREATKAGWSLNDALRECCERGWQGFKAEWVNSNKGKSNGNGSRPSGWLS